MTRIPIDANGWKVNPDTGTIHTRYADAHTGQVFRTRTTKGVLTILAGKRGIACRVCYGDKPPYPQTSPRPPQRRRSAPEARNATPAAVPGE